MKNAVYTVSNFSMDGVFMRYVLKITAICITLAVLCLFGSVLADRQKLSNDMIRLHVVAQSDSESDQAVKLKVRDAVLAEVGFALRQQGSAGDARAWLEDHLDEVTAAANRALRDAGTEQTAVVSLQKESFPRRDYETFSLPSGVYESLVVRIGDAQGRNWWCVVFPALCFGTNETFESTAAGAGFSQPLIDSVQKPDTQIRFFFLDCLGWLQNLFFNG